MSFFTAAAVALCLVAQAPGGSPRRQLVLSANDAKVTLVDGVTTVVSNPPPDTVTVIDVAASPPKIVAEIPAPASIVGPPSSVAVAPDQSIALVTAATRIDPADPAKTSPDDRVSVIDLQASPPAVIATLRGGRGASGVSINRAGNLALVANRIDGTVSVFRIAGKTVTAAGTVDLGAPDSGPCHAAFTPDGRTALVTRNNDSLISVLRVEGNRVEYTKRDITAGLKPYGLVVAPAGNTAVVAHVGAGPTGSVDTVAVIDLAGPAPRTVAHVTVGPTAEAISFSPDGRHVAVTVMNGSNAARSAPFFNDYGLLKILALNDRTLAPVAEARIGHWCQGAEWNRDGAMLLVQCAVEREILLFDFDGRRLARRGSLAVGGAPSGIGTAR